MSIPSPPLWSQKKKLTPEEIKKITQLHEAKLNELIIKERTRILIMLTNREKKHSQVANA